MSALHAPHEENIVDHRVITPIAEAADRADAGHVDHAVDDHGVVDMHVDDFADHHFIAVRFAVAAGEAHGLGVHAFERDRRTRHPRWLDLARGRHDELRQFRLADIFGIIAAADIHLGAQVVGGEIEYEFAAPLGM